MVRCKETEKSRTRNVLWTYISGLDFSAEAADRRLGADC